MKSIILHKFQVKKTCCELNNKIFASRRLEAAVAYGCKSIGTNNLCGLKDPGSVQSNGEIFLVVSFFNCKTTTHEDQVQFPAVKKFRFSIANFEYLFSHVKCFDYHRIQCPNSANQN